MKGADAYEAAWSYATRKMRGGMPATEAARAALESYGYSMFEKDKPRLLRELRKLEVK